LYLTKMLPIMVVEVWCLWVWQTRQGYKPSSVLP